MLKIYPSILEQFHCTAEHCRHSCCIGWEIDIDADTLAYYESIPAECGLNFEQTIEKREGEACFRLDSEERCPYLRKDGLCRLILRLGEESLCDICREHPRFYNSYSFGEEAGVGLCCEEAVRLLLEPGNTLQFHTEGSLPRRTAKAKQQFLEEKAAVLKLLLDSETPFESRLQDCRERYDLSGNMPEASALYNFMHALERLDESWDRRLERLWECPDTLLRSPIQFEGADRFCAYLVFRHLTWEHPNYRRVLAMAVFATKLINGIVREDGDIQETIRSFSAEIEYSQENLAAFEQYAAECLCGGNGN